MHSALQPSLRVEAVLCGIGGRPWAWAIYGSNPVFAVDRSEAMFRSAAAATRAGLLVMQYREARTRTRDGRTLH
jgi:hypothetical protein